jgi:uncharacterized paraquat-inducible protein A
MPMGAGFFVIWLLCMVGGFIGWIVFLVAVCRIARAHEHISQTLRTALLQRDLRPQETEYDKSETTKCLKCGATISEDQTKCPECGWSWDAGNSSPG